MILATVSSSSSFNRDVRAALDARFRFEAVWDLSYEDAARLEGVRSDEKCLNIIDFKNQAQALPVARAISGRTQVTTIGINCGTTSEELLLLMQAGVRDVLSQFTTRDLLQAANRVLAPLGSAGTVSDPKLAERIINRLNADPECASLQQPADLPFGVAMMVAGKRLRGMGGEAILVTHGSGGHSDVTLDLSAYSGTHKGRPNALKVLVAEDSNESFALTAIALEEEQVWRAHNGQEALSMIRKHGFDLVFMDVHMPGMDGYEVIRSMREWETQTGQARTPLVVLSSDDLETQQRSAAEFGCSGFLLKPLRRWDLTPLLERLK